MGARLGFTLSKEEVEQLKVDTYLIDRVVQALSQLKQCRTEAEREDYHIVLAALAPKREAERSREGMLRAASQRLRVERGVRYFNGEKRPYAFDQAVARRAVFDEAVFKCSDALKPGDEGISHGQLCTVVEIDHKEDTCALRFSQGGVEAVREYTCIYRGSNPRKQAPFPQGSARLRRAPPSLRVQVRERRCDEKMEAARAKVEELFDAEGARSPSQRDSVRRRVGVGLYENTQALIVFAKYSALYTLYCSRYPANHISFSTFKSLRPWYVRRAKEESCLCKHCDNFKQQQTTLHSLVCLFERFARPPPNSDADDAPPDDQQEESEFASSWSGNTALRQLMEFCALQSKSDMVRFMLCAGAFEGAGKEECINGKCQVCGFKMLWSSGLRPHVLDKNGNICSRAPLEFQTTVKWVRIRSSKQETPGEASKTAYEQRQGTIVQFLDEFESESSRKFPHHRFTVQRQKQTDTQFQRERWPGWLQFDIDFAMDGTIPPPEGRSMQSDHWTPMSYTLFINIASWLDTDKWTSRTSRLTKGSAVTVEPSESSVAGATTPPTGSFWAEVVTVPSNVGSNCAESADQNVDHSVLLYGVRRHGAPKDAPPQLIERRYLRDRVMKTKAFIHVSDDKTHDSNAAQKFLNQTFESLDEHYVAAGKEKFVALRMHSDNAPSHFKNSKMMHFLTTLQERLKNSWAPGHNIFRVVWDFGPPGHGKGVWDGIGAWMKRTVRQDVVDHRPPSMPTILTSNGVILSPKQVAEHLQVSNNKSHFHVCASHLKILVSIRPALKLPIISQLTWTKRSTRWW